MSERVVELAAHSLAVGSPEGCFALSAKTLREACRCASCRAAERAGQPVEARDDIALASFSEVGGYALQLRFSDGHERGIYPWSLLRELAEAQSTQVL